VAVPVGSTDAQGQCHPIRNSERHRDDDGQAIENLAIDNVTLVPEVVRRTRCDAVRVKGWHIRASTRYDGPVADALLDPVKPSDSLDASARLPNGELLALYGFDPFSFLFSSVDNRRWFSRVGKPSAGRCTRVEIMAVYHGRLVRSSATDLEA
jgi:hypothetical protein